MSTLLELRLVGVRLRLDGDDMAIESDTPLTDVHTQFLRDHKDELVADLRARQQHLRRMYEPYANGDPCPRCLGGGCKACDYYGDRHHFVDWAELPA
jgi:hypothetical protein